MCVITVANTKYILLSPCDTVVSLSSRIKTWREGPERSGIVRPSFKRRENPEGIKSPLVVRTRAITKVWKKQFRHATWELLARRLRGVRYHAAYLIVYLASRSSLIAPASTMAPCQANLKQAPNIDCSPRGIAAGASGSVCVRARTEWSPVRDELPLREGGLGEGLRDESHLRRFAKSPSDCWICIERRFLADRALMIGRESRMSSHVLPQARFASHLHDVVRRQRRRGVKAPVNPISPRVTCA